MILIYITYPNKEEAAKIINHLLQKKLIACANIFPIESFYHWKGKIENDQEFVSIIKTNEESWEKVKTEVKKLHSYEVPCIIKLDGKANKEFEDWINSELK